MTKPFRLSRRAVLRGAGGIAIALPWLEIMDPERRSFAASAPAQRFLAVYQPGGTVYDQWRPTGTEKNFTLSPILAPFAPVKDRIVVLDGIDMKSATGGGTDAGGMVAWLSGTAPTSASGYAQGPSIDQVLATRLVGTRPLRSLNMAVRWGTGRSKGLTTPLDIVSFEDNPTFTPIPPRLDPQAIWSELFGALPPNEGAWDRSILDAVAGRYQRLASKLGRDDRARLERHLAEVRALEMRLGALRGCLAPTRVDTTRYNPASGLNSANDGSIRDLPTDEMIPTVGRFMTDMMVMAFACDLTAVGVLQWTDAECKHTLPWLGLTETHRFYMNDGGYHPIECARIATWYSEQHTYLVQALAAVDMGGHTLLDESIVFFGAHLQDPATYSKANMPFVLAGNGGGLETGRYLVYDHPSHNDLLVSLLGLFGDGRATFGDTRYSTGPLPML